MNTIITDRDIFYMNMALAQARKAARLGEVPVGAVVVCKDTVIAAAHNMTEALTDVTAHAEILAITSAANALGSKYLPDCTLYVTVEPCLMCAGAIAWSQIKRVVIGTSDPKKGYAVQTCKMPFHPKTQVVTGVCAEECAALMTDFFKKRR